MKKIIIFLIIILIFIPFVNSAFQTCKNDEMNYFLPTRARLPESSYLAMEDVEIYINGTCQRGGCNYDPRVVTDCYTNCINNHDYFNFNFTRACRDLGNWELGINNSRLPDGNYSLYLATRSGYLYGSFPYPDYIYFDKIFKNISIVSTSETVCNSSTDDLVGNYFGFIRATTGNYIEEVIIPGTFEIVNCKINNSGDTIKIGWEDSGLKSISGLGFKAINIYNPVDCSGICLLNETFTYTSDIQYNYWSGFSISPDSQFRLNCSGMSNYIWRYLSHLASDSDGIITLNYSLHKYSGDYDFSIALGYGSDYPVWIAYKGNQTINLANGDVLNEFNYSGGNDYKLVIDLHLHYFDFYVNGVLQKSTQPFYNDVDYIDWIMLMPDVFMGGEHCSVSIDNILMYGGLSIEEQFNQEQGVIDWAGFRGTGSGDLHFDKSRCKLGENINICAFRLMSLTLLGGIFGIVTKYFLYVLLVIVIIIIIYMFKEKFKK